MNLEVKLTGMAMLGVFVASCGRTGFDPTGSPSCMDGVPNGDETDTDCGGGCPDCPDGSGCLVSDDCVSGYCSASLQCTAPGCSDGVQNQDETGRDCGGSCPAGCPDGIPCQVHGDCLSTFCNPSFQCQSPSCADGFQNQGEVAIDCGGPCAPCGLCVTQSEIPESECEALMALYDDTDGANWTTNTGWAATAAPCSWFGVTCNAGRVTFLHLSVNQLSGNIPTELGDLTNLSILFLNVNQLSGNIPTELGNLGNLEVLNFAGNQLSGNIPTELGDLDNLRALYLNNNQLSGNIPEELRNLTALEMGYFSLNQFTGLGGTVCAGWTAVTLIDFGNNSWGQPAVDEALSQLYSARSTYTATTPELVIVGSNAAPSGTYTDPNVVPGSGSTDADWSWNGSCHEPRTGKARIYALENDVCTEGFNTWSISFTP